LPPRGGQQSGRALLFALVISKTVKRASFGSAVATGLHVEAGLYLRGATLTGYEARSSSRVALATVPAPTRVWGYALGRARLNGKRTDRFFVLAWLAATGFEAFSITIFGRGRIFSGAMPLFRRMLFVSFLGARELAQTLPLWRIESDFRSFEPAPPPSLRAARRAATRQRPVGALRIVLGRSSRWV
jgi:hypothetical protein